MKLYNTLASTSIDHKALWFNFLIKCATQESATSSLLADEVIKSYLIDDNNPSNVIVGLIRLAETVPENADGIYIQTKLYAVIANYIKYQKLNNNTDYKKGLQSDQFDFNFDEEYFLDEDLIEKNDLSDIDDSLAIRQELNELCDQITRRINSISMFEGSANISNWQAKNFPFNPDVYLIAAAQIPLYTDSTTDSVKEEFNEISSGEKYAAEVEVLANRGIDIKAQLDKNLKAFREREAEALKIDISNLSEKDKERLMGLPGFAKRKRNRLDEIVGYQQRRESRELKAALYNANKWQEAYANLTPQEHNTRKKDQYLRMIKYNDTQGRKKSLSEQKDIIMESLNNSGVKFNERGIITSTGYMEPEDLKENLSKIKLIDKKLVRLNARPQQTSFIRQTEAGGTSFLKKIISLTLQDIAPIVPNAFNPEKKEKIIKVPDWPEVELEGYVHHWNEAIGNQRKAIKENVYRNLIKDIKIRENQIAPDILKQIKGTPAPSKAKELLKDKYIALEEKSLEEINEEIENIQKRIRFIDANSSTSVMLALKAKKDNLEQAKKEIISEQLKSSPQGLLEIIEKYFGSDQETKIKERIKQFAKEQKIDVEDVTEEMVSKTISKDGDQATVLLNDLLMQLQKSEFELRGAQRTAKIRDIVKLLANQVRIDQIRYGIRSEFFTAFVIHVRTSCRFRDYGDALFIAKTSNLHRKMWQDMDNTQLEFFTSLLEKGTKMRDFYSSIDSNLVKNNLYKEIPEIPKLYYISNQIRTLNYLVEYLSRINTIRYMIKSSQQNFIESYSIENLQEILAKAESPIKQIGILNSFRIELKNQTPGTERFYQKSRIFAPLFEREITKIKSLPDDTGIEYSQFINFKKNISQFKNTNIYNNLYNYWYNSAFQTSDAESEAKKNLVDYQSYKNESTWRTFRICKEAQNSEYFAELDAAFTTVGIDKDLTANTSQKFNTVWNKIKKEFISNWSDEFYQFLETPVGKNWLNNISLPEDPEKRQQEIKRQSTRSLWLTEEFGQDWLRTEAGINWLKTEKGKDWLKTEDGINWITNNYSTISQDIIQAFEPNDNWLISEPGKKWIVTKSGTIWLRAPQNLNRIKALIAARRKV